MRHLRACTGILVVFWLSYLVVRPTNFSGWDEWLVVDLTWRDIVGLPYENRPYSLLFSLLGAMALPHSLIGYWLAHGLYLSYTGVLAYRLSLAFAPDRAGLAFLAGVFCVIWAPLDVMRLDAVLIGNYSGFTFGTFLALVVFVESALARHWFGLSLAAGLAFILIRGLESTAGLLAAAPALLWLAPRVARRTRVTWSAVWLLAAVPALALAALPLLPGRPGSYQVSGLGFDPHPLRVAGRLLRQFGFHLGPVFALSPSGWGLSVLVVVAAFAVGWRLRRPTATLDERMKPLEAGRLAVIGLGLAALAYAVLCLSHSVVSPSRMQILSAPGIGLLLAAIVTGLADRAPGRGREVAVIVLGGWVVAQGAARTAGLQLDWDRNGYWPAQSQALYDLTRAAPQLEPNTFVLLLDERGTWPATFTFRHALQYLYGGRAIGTVWNAEPFLYPIRLEAGGIVSLPYESIRGPWQIPMTWHRWDEILVARQSASGTLVVLDRWPDESLPPLPPGAVYAPLARIRRDLPRPREQELLLPGPAGLW